MTTPTADADLLDASISGDQRAFGDLVDRHKALVCAVTYSLTGDHGKSEDLAQETFVVAWSRLDKVYDASALRPWLCGIARNLALQSRDKARRDPLAHAVTLDRAGQVDGLGASPSDHAMAREREEEVWRALQEIPETYRIPLILYYREGRSVRRVAEVVGLSEANVKQRLHRGRRMLKEHIAAAVEESLVRSRPGESFAIGVLVALPGSTSGTEAAPSAASVVPVVVAPAANTSLTGLSLAAAKGLAAACLVVLASLGGIRYFAGVSPSPAEAATPLTVEDIVREIRLGDERLGDVEVAIEQRWLNDVYRGERDPLRYSGVWSHGRHGQRRFEGEVRLRSSSAVDGYEVKRVVEVVDGSDYRKLYWEGEQPRGVTMPSEFGLELERGASPWPCLGLGLTPNTWRFSSVADILEYGVETTVSQDVDLGGVSCVRVDTLIHKPPENNDWEAERYRAWLDPACGYRPRQVEVYSNRWPALLTRVDGIELEEIAEGLWFPVSGRDTSFGSVPRVVGTDARVKQVLRMPREQRFAHLAFDITSSSATQFKASECRAAQGFPAEHFAVRFPQGAVVTDRYSGRIFESP